MPSEISIGERVKIQREVLNMSQAELARKVGFKSRSSVQKIEKGVQLPSSKILELSRILQVSPEYLMGKNDNPDKLRSTAIGIPVLCRIVSSAPVVMSENIIDYEKIPEEMATTGEYFALKIEDISMEPKIEKGAIVIAREQQEAGNGDIVIVLFEEGNAICRKLAISSKLSEEEEGLFLEDMKVLRAIKDNAIDENSDCFINWTNRVLAY